MNKLLAMFDVIVNRELELLKQIYSQVLDEQYAIVKNDINGYTKAFTCKEQLTNELNTLEKKRMAVGQKLAQTLEMEADKTGLRDFIVSLPSPHRERFTQLRKKMRAICERIQIKSQSNRILIKSSLDYIEHTMNLVANAQSSANPTYNSQATVAAAKSGGSWLINAEG